MIRVFFNEPTDIVLKQGLYAATPATSRLDLTDAEFSIFQSQNRVVSYRTVSIPDYTAPFESRLFSLSKKATSIPKRNPWTVPYYDNPVNRLYENSVTALDKYSPDQKEELNVNPV